MSDKTLQQEMEELRLAWLDLVYVTTRPIQRFAVKIGMELKPWVKEAQAREAKRKS